MLRRMSIACEGFNDANCEAPGRFDASDPNWVIHCAVGAVLRKPGAARVAGAPNDRHARREAPLRSMVLVVVGKARNY